MRVVELGRNLAKAALPEGTGRAASASACFLKRSHRSVSLLPERWEGEEGDVTADRGLCKASLQRQELPPLDPVRPGSRSVLIRLTARPLPFDSTVILGAAVHIRRKEADRKAAGKAAADKGKWEKALAVDKEFPSGVAMRPVLRGRGPTFLARRGSQESSCRTVLSGDCTSLPMNRNALHYLCLIGADGRQRVMLATPL